MQVKKITKRKRKNRSNILFNPGKRNASPERYLFRRCELAAAKRRRRRRIDRLGRRSRDGRLLARGIGAFDLATANGPLAAAIEIR